MTTPTEPRDGRRPAARLIAFGLIIFATSGFTLDAIYLFQDVGFGVAKWRPGLSTLAGDVQRLGEQPATAWLLQVPLPLPLEFVRGVDFQLADTEQVQSAYLLGETRLGGWWYWYVAACLFKLPLPVWVLYALALFAFPSYSESLILSSGLHCACWLPLWRASS